MSQPLLLNREARLISTPPAALAPHLRRLIKLVPDPEGPECKTESPLSDRTIETIRLMGWKENAIPPGDTKPRFYASTTQAKLSFGNSPVKRSPQKPKATSKGNIRKAAYNPLAVQNQRKAAADRQDKLRLDYASQQSAVYGNM